MKDKNVRNSGMGFISVLTLMFVDMGIISNLDFVDFNCLSVWNNFSYWETKKREMVNYKMKG